MAEKKLLIMVGIVDSEEDKYINKDLLDSLKGICLKEGGDYYIESLPLGFDERHQAPMIVVEKGNSLGLGRKTFYGVMGMELFLNQARPAQAKAQGATQNG